MIEETPTDDKPVSSGSCALWILGLILLGLGLWSLLMPLVIYPKEAARRSSSKNALRHLGLAIYNYNDEFGQFPAGMLIPAKGGPAYGWPVFLLPFTDNDALYGSLDLSKPYWDPENQKVIQVEIFEYHNPMFDETEHPDAAMDYALNSRVFHPNRNTKLEEITDGNSNTFMGGEIADGIRLWYQPDHTRDPALGLNKGPHTFGSPYFGTKYGTRVQMLMMDGSVRAIPNETGLDVLKALATPAAGDDPGDF